MPTAVAKLGAGRIEFVHPRYRDLRRQINSLIRYAYHVNFSTLLLTIVARRIAPETFALPSTRERIEADRELDAETKAGLIEIHNKTITAIGRQVALTSITAMSALVLVVACRLVYLLFSSSLRIEIRKEVFLREPVVQHIQYMEAQALQSEEHHDVCDAAVA